MVTSIRRYNTSHQAFRLRFGCCAGCPQGDTPDTLLFVDPPYMHSTRDAATVSSGAYRHEMTDAQHAELLHVLLGCKGKVMLTGYAHPLYDDMLAGWHRVTRQARASGNTGGVLRTEVLWMNYQPGDEQLDIFGEAV